MKEDLPAISCRVSDLAQLESDLLDLTTASRSYVELNRGDFSRQIDGFDSMEVSLLLDEETYTGYEIQIRGTEGVVSLFGSSQPSDTHTLRVKGDAEWEQKIRSRVNIFIEEVRDNRRKLLSEYDTEILIALSVVSTSYFTTLLPGIQMVFPPGILSYVTFFAGFTLLLFVYKRRVFSPYILLTRDRWKMGKAGLIQSSKTAFATVCFIILLRILFGRKLYNGIGISVFDIIITSFPLY